MSNDQNLELLREIAALRREVAKLRAVLPARPLDGADMTIPEWCARRRLSRGSFYKLRKVGKGPAVIMVGNAVRITREADEMWEAARQAETAKGG